MIDKPTYDTFWYEGINMTDENLPIDDDDDDNDFNFGQHEALSNMGIMGLTVLRAVLRDGGTWNEAFSVTAAYFAGMTKGMMSDD